VVVDEYLDLFDDESDLDAYHHMLSDDYSDGEELIEVFSSDADPVPDGSE